MIPNRYNPDVLSCLANLSNDEVFTPPTVVNKMLDILPTELWSNSKATFLDPVSKTGIFLREIAKRLMVGLVDEIPDTQERVNHILTKQIFGIAITELTSLLSRRSLYCSKRANSALSVCNIFDNEEGNIIFSHTPHSWERERCKFCGASQAVFERAGELESHAYQFIHTNNPETIFENMRFDVIIGNPPYQLNVGNISGNSSKAKAIYHEFISQAMKLAPRYLTMITPSRWMTRSTEGIPDNWINDMICDKRIKIMHDFLDSSDCFPGVDIMGGVNYFLWNRDYVGKCTYVLHMPKTETVLTHCDYLDSRKAGIVIRDIKALSIVEKIEKIDNGYIRQEKNNFSSLVSPKDFFTNKEVLTSSWNGYQTYKDNICNIRYYLNKNIHKSSESWVAKTIIPKNLDTVKYHKVYIPAANGSLDFVLGKPFYGEPNSVCSQTYLVIGYKEEHNLDEEKCKNIY